MSGSSLPPSTSHSRHSIKERVHRRPARRSPLHHARLLRGRAERVDHVHDGEVADDGTLVLQIVVKAEALGGQMLWLLGLCMAAGAMLGGWLGSHSAIRFGARLIRPLLVVISLGLTARLLWGYFASS